MGAAIRPRPRWACGLRGLACATRTGFCAPFLAHVTSFCADRPIDLLAPLPVSGIDPDTVLWTSSKTGAGINEILPAVASRLPGATGSPTAPLQCLIFDSWFDEYRGVICIINVVNGTLRPGMTVSPASTGLKYHVHEVGLVTPVRYQSPQLSAGQVGVFSIYGILGRRCCRV